MWPANRASTHVRESRAEGLSCGVQRAATWLSSGACGLVLPEPAVGCQTQLSQRALSNLALQPSPSAAGRGTFQRALGPSRTLQQPFSEY